MMKNGCQQGHNIKYLNTDSHWTTPRHIAKINIALLKNRNIQFFQWCLEKICTEVLRHCINTVFLMRSIISDIGEPLCHLQRGSERSKYYCTVPAQSLDNWLFSETERRMNFQQSILCLQEVGHSQPPCCSSYLQFPSCILAVWWEMGSSPTLQPG